MLKSNVRDTFAGSQQQQGQSVLRRPRTPAIYTILIIASLAVTFPFVTMLLTSVTPQSDVITFPPRVIPQTLTGANYMEIWTQIPFALYLRNSVIYATTVTSISLIFDSMCAYALARLSFKGRDLLFLAILATMMIPQQVTMIPLFLNLSSLKWINTYQGLIIPHLTSPFGIFLLRQFFLSIPRDIEDAGRIDGAGEFRIYWQIVLPLTKPALASLFVFHFTYNWNDFLWPLIITTSPSMRTLPTGLALFMGEHNVQYGLLMAGATISAAPLVIAFVFAQRYFVQGIALSGLKE
jgi:multiple sugar transport system permease protein